jgi:ribose transport system permease protein
VALNREPSHFVQGAIRRLNDRIPLGLRTYLFPIVLTVVLGALLLAFVPNFFNIRNLENVTRQASSVGIVAVGMTFVIMTAGIDLSVGAILAVTSVLFATLLEGSVPVPLAVVISIGVGMVIGLANAFGVTFLRIQPFIMTLATAAIVGGLALRATNGTQIRLTLLNNQILDFFGSGSFLGMPGPVVIFLVCAVVGWAGLRYTTFGRYIYAVGGSQEAARLSGVRIRAVLFGAYAICGAGAAIAGLMYTSRLAVGDPTAGSTIALDAIAAVVIGGTSLAGGSGSMLGTVFGALLLATIANVLALLGVSSFDQQVVKGVVIIVAVLFASLATRPVVRPEPRRAEQPEVE